MKQEQLVELGLTEEQVAAVIEGFGKMIPKARLDEKIEQVNDYKQQLDERDTQLKELQKQATGNEELQEQIQQLQQANEVAATEYQNDLMQKDYDFTLTEALREAKAKNPKAVNALLDRELIKLEDGKLKGLEEQLTALKETDDYLFVADGLKGGTPPQGGSPSPKATANMSYTELAQYLEANPDAEI